MTGIELIAKERQEQIEKHGYDADNDAYYSNGELLQAAKYCLESNLFSWPKSWDLRAKDKIDNKTDAERLVVGAAFISAELDRMNFKKH